MHAAVHFLHECSPIVTVQGWQYWEFWRRVWVAVWSLGFAEEVGSVAVEEVGSVAVEEVGSVAVEEVGSVAVEEVGS